MKALKLIVTALALACLVSAFAQQGRGGMRGQDQGIGLVTRADVQADLGVTAEQKAKLDALQQKTQEQMRARFQEMRDNGGDFESIRAEMDKHQAQINKEIAAILTPEQNTRLKQIRVQLQGNRAILDKEIQKDLGISESQKAQIEKLQADQQSAMQDMMADMRDGGMSREEMQAEMQKRNQSYEKKLGEILTAQQAETLKGMGGKPFKAQQRGGQ